MELNYKQDLGKDNAINQKISYLEKTVNQSLEQGNTNNTEWGLTELVKANSNDVQTQQSLRSALVSFYGDKQDWHKGASVMDHLVAVDELNLKSQHKDEHSLPNIFLVDKAVQSAFHDADLAASQGQRPAGFFEQAERFSRANQDLSANVPSFDAAMAKAADAIKQITKFNFDMPEPRSSHVHREHEKPGILL